MHSTLAELKTRFLKASLWITLCKTFEEMLCKSLIHHGIDLQAGKELKIGQFNLCYKSITYRVSVGFMRRLG